MELIREKKTQQQPNTKKLEIDVDGEKISIQKVKNFMYLGILIIHKREEEL